MTQLDIQEAERPPTSTSAPRRSVRARGRRDRWVVAALALALVIAALVSMGIGRLPVPVDKVGLIVLDELGRTFGLKSPIPQDWTNGEHSAVILIRAPRTLLAIIVGAALAISGAVLQALFRNPLVSPDVIGVSAGASFGGVLTILLGLGGFTLIGGSFVFGLAAALLVMLLSRLRTSSPVLTIVLGGIVISALFNALVSLVTYLADPYTTLPSITFWLMGSFAATTWTHVGLAVGPFLLGLIVVMALRWRLNILSLGDEEARALHVHPGRLRVLLIITVSLLTAMTVAVSGAIGWVGLVIPHLVRLALGGDHRTLLPASALAGGLYMLVVDTLARSMAQVEVPVGILTAIIGAPVFVALLVRGSRTGGNLA
jgi:iron complex transport system permease protein